MLTDLFRFGVAGYVRRQPRETRKQMMDRVLAFQIGRFGWLTSFAAALFFARDLRMLATFYMTDKWNSHWYAQHYEDLFRRIRRKKLKVLEIGIGGEENPSQGGNSLRMWRTYFPNSQIYGLDLFDKSPHNARRIKTFKGSQDDPVALGAIVREAGPLDIIIDDGSHRNDHVLYTFHYLFPHLADDGFYVVEDTQTSYWEDLGGNQVERNDPSTMMGYFKSLIDGLNWEEIPGYSNPTYFDLNIKSIFFYHNLIVLKKGSNREHHLASRPGDDVPPQTR
jgi:hypothetical protein